MNHFHNRLFSESGLKELQYTVCQHFSFSYEVATREAGFFLIDIDKPIYKTTVIN